MPFWQHPNAVSLFRVIGQGVPHSFGTFCRPMCLLRPHQMPKLQIGDLFQFGQGVTHSFGTFCANVVATQLHESPNW